jgi:hypothetical protein
MSSEIVDLDSIGPKLSLADVALPPAVGERFGRLYGVAEPPRTAADWIAVTRDRLSSQGEGQGQEQRPTVEDLCTSDDGAHTFVGEGGRTSGSVTDGDADATDSQSYVCVLDPLAYPFLVDEPGTVHSETPVRDAEVVFEVGRDSLAVTPDTAVVSLGVSDHVDAVEDVTVETIYRQVCGYIHAFEDEAEYEQWRGDVEAATTSLPAEEGVAVAREIALTLFDAGG